MSGNTGGPQASLPGKVLVIGSQGRMGSMFLDEAAKKRVRAVGVDVPFSPEELARGADRADLALFCVPASKLPEALAAVLPYLGPQTIVADITSVKERPMRQMEAAWPGSVVGTHPLFGPRFSADDDLPVTLVPGARASADDIKKVASFFERLGCRVFESSAEQHDQAMARIQNMNFITNLAYFAALAEQKDLLPFLTPSFERRKTAAAKMLTEDAEMFEGLFEANMHSHEAVRQFSKMLNVAASGDLEVLRKRARWWWTEA